MSCAFPAVLVLLTAATALAQPGGSNGYAAITIDGGRVRYSLTLWPATLPPPVGDQIRRAREGDAPSRDRLLGVIRDKVTLPRAPVYRLGQLREELGLDRGRAEPGRAAARGADAATLRILTHGVIPAFR